MSWSTRAAIACSCVIAGANVATASDTAHRAEAAINSTALRAAWVAQHGDAIDAATEPALVGGSIVTPTVNVTRRPGAPIVSVTLTTGSVGVSSVMITVTSPSGSQVVFGQYSVPQFPPQKPRISLPVEVQSPFSQDGFGIYAEAGTWSVTQVQVSSNDGTQLNYGGADLAHLLQGVTFTVVNPNKPDTTPPTIAAGSILTPVISLSGANPYFAAKISAHDGGSGVTSVMIVSTPPSGGFFEPEVFPPSPMKTGPFYPAAGLGNSAATGTYTIIDVAACDAAGNCNNIESPSAIQALLGTTTFQVTK